MSKLTHSLEETRSVLYVTFSISLWLHKHTNSLYNVKTWFLTSQGGWGVYSPDLPLALAHHTLFCLSSPQGKSQAQSCLGPTNVLGEPHIHIHTPDKIKQQQGKGWKCGHRLHKLWAVFCPVTTNSSLDCNHQQRFWAHTPYPQQDY